MINFLFFINSILFGVGLAMDAFSVSIANAMNDPLMPQGKRLAIAGTFGGFQILMPMIGWICVHTIVNVLKVVELAVPWAALVILVLIGTKMILESVRSMRSDEDDFKPAVGFVALMVQGIATSLDALSVGFTIAELSWQLALLESLIIGVVTFVICTGGLMIGRTFGTKLKNKAGIFGGIILICIGLEIFLTNIL